jgi:large subunit ribosomal protein L21
MKKVQKFFWQSSLLDDNGTITLGAPAIEGASVEAKVLQHLKGDKVIVFKEKKKRIQKKRSDSILLKL